MSTFALFAGDTYYPAGGWHDFIDSYDTLFDAVSAPLRACDWAHVVDLRTGVIVAEWRGKRGWRVRDDG